MKNKFLDIEEISFNEAQAVIVPFGFEATTTFGRGTKNGPAAIIKVSSQVELFDEELWQETYKKVKIATLSEDKKANLKNLETTVGKILKNKKLPVVLGGEHSLTPFIIGAYKDAGFKDFSILQFDAHADLRDGYLGHKFSHASAMRRSLDFDGINPHTYVNSKQGKQSTQELDKKEYKYSRENNLGVGVNLVQVGIRNISNENDELVFWKKNQGIIKTFWAHTKSASPHESAHANYNISDILKCLKEKVYLTFDVDVFDSSIMPATGTPEPGGLGWYEVLDILRAVCAKREIIGADFVELAPIKNLPAPDFLVAKLIYKTIGYIFNK